MNANMNTKVTILEIDKLWNPHRWIPLKEAICQEAKGLITDHLGESIFVYHGGINRVSGKRSIIETSSIIVVDGAPNPRKHRDPALVNQSLFQRDHHVCAYCGGHFRAEELTRDHVIPTSKGGKDKWMNVVTACKSCNMLKGNIMPGEKLPGKAYGPQLTGKMDPLYVPYVPCRAEHMILKSRNIKADQMQFLLERVKNQNSRIFNYADNMLKGVAA
jgi:5-methylcytosine-specific restriction endonuclease McrA